MLGYCQSQWPCGPRRSSAVVVRLLGLRVRIPRMFVSCVCCIGSGLCDELITRTEETYRLCVCVISRNLTNTTA